MATLIDNGIFSWLIGNRNKQSGIDFDALNQFVVGLRSELDVLVYRLVEHTDKDQQTIQAISKQLDGINQKDSVEANWNRVYHAEKQLLSLYGGNRVDIELARRMDQCDRLKAPFHVFYTEMMTRRENGAMDISDDDLLLSIVSDLQWFNSRRYINMRYARLAIYKVGSVFVLSFAIFLLVLSFGHWS